MKEMPIRRTNIDWKGITAFLLMTFVITYGVEGLLILYGVSPLVKGIGQYTVAAVMWVPALATVLTIKLITHEGFQLTNIRIGEWRPYVGGSGTGHPGLFRSRLWFGRQSCIWLT